MAARSVSRHPAKARSNALGRRRRWTGAFAIAALVVLGLPLAGAQQAATPQPAPPRAQQESNTSMTIQLKIDGQTVLATLDDNATTRDFLSLLPLTLTLRDYNRTEKVSDLPRRLSTEGAPAGIDPAIGDITYYAPWGNLALFYRDFGYASGLVRLGRIETGVDILSGPGPFTVTIDRVETPRKDTP